MACTDLWPLTYQVGDMSAPACARCGRFAFEDCNGAGLDCSPCLLVPDHAWKAKPIFDPAIRGWIDLTPSSAPVPAKISTVASAPLVDAPFAVSKPAQVAPEAKAAFRQMAQMQVYTGDSCTTCGNFTMTRNGTCLKCMTCGSTTERN